MIVLFFNSLLLLYAQGSKEGSVRFIEIITEDVDPDSCKELSMQCLNCESPNFIEKDSSQDKCSRTYLIPQTTPDLLVLLINGPLENKMVRLWIGDVPDTMVAVFVKDSTVQVLSSQKNSGQFYYDQYAAKRQFLAEEINRNHITPFEADSLLIRFQVEFIQEYPNDLIALNILSQIIFRIEKKEGEFLLNLIKRSSPYQQTKYFDQINKILRFKKDPIVNEKLKFLDNYSITRKDSALIFYVWNTGCVPSRQLGPKLSSLVSELHPEIKVVGIHMGPEQQASANSFQEFKFSGKNIYLDEGAYDPFILNYGISATPTLLYFKGNRLTSWHTGSDLMDLKNYLLENLD